MELSEAAAIGFCMGVVATAFLAYCFWKLSQKEAKQDEDLEVPRPKEECG